MKTMSVDNTQASKIFIVFALLLYTAEVLEKILSSLHPEDHFLEWTCCLSGAIGGQVFFRPDSLNKSLTETIIRSLGGLFVGYMAGLYWGIDLAKALGLTEPNAGQALAACLADVTGRSLDYIIRHPNESADFVIKKGGKLLSVLGTELVGKGLEFLKGLFKKG